MEPDMYLDSPSFDEYSEINSGFEMYADSKVLYVFTMGLGGPRKSDQLLTYLKSICHQEPLKYTHIVIHAFGKDVGKGSDRVLTTYILTELINQILPTRCVFGWVSYFNMDLPTAVPLGKGSLETRVIAVKLQESGETYKFFDGKPFTYSESDNAIIEKIRSSFNTFLTTVKDGDILIDNHAVIYGSPPSNKNFEYMPWLPQVLSSLKNDDRIFLLKDKGDYRPPTAVPFFSRDAVYIYSTQELIFLPGSGSSSVASSGAGGAGAGAAAGAAATTGGTRRRRRQGSCRASKTRRGRRRG